MTLRELLADVEYKSSNMVDVQINNVSDNSREIDIGDLFVAIDGVLVDGHGYISNAINNGAIAVVSEKPIKVDGSIIIIRVKNSRLAYTQICANLFGNPSRSLKFIGITGTNGKTSSAYLAYHILKACNKKVGLIGTVENITGKGSVSAKFTTPDAMNMQKLLREMVQTDIEYVVMEVSSHALSQDRVANITFDVGAFTNLTQDHLDYHGTMENYKNEKLKLMRQSKKAVINIDDTAASDFVFDVKGDVYTIGIEKDAYFKAESINELANKTDFIVTSIEGDYKTSVSIRGLFSVYNSLIAIGIARAIGISLKNACSALSKEVYVSGRMENFETGRDFQVVLDYAHTPDSLEKALKTLKSQKDISRLIVVFGCGGDRDKDKRHIMGKIAVDNADFVVITSDNPRSEDPISIINDIKSGVEDSTTIVEIISDRKKAIKYAIDNAQPNDVILLAGKGHETYQILKTGKIHFDEREVLAEILSD